LLASISSAIQGQHSKALMDTITLKKGQVFVTLHSKYTILSDTVITIPSNIKYEIWPSKSDAFFNKLAQKADRRLWTRELHNIIVSRQSNPVNNDTLKTSSSLLPFVFYTGKPIRNIQIKRLDVFGPTINDTSRTAINWIERVGNKLHFQSKEYLIRYSLLFKAGDLIDPTILADNERVLRGLPYLEDAKILVKPAGELSDSADILVIVKDVWSKAFDIKIDNVYSGQFQMWDRNIFGLGQEIQNNIHWNTHEMPSTGYDGAYLINNIFGSFISGKLFYYNSFHNESHGITLERSFFTPNIKYAGGASFYNTQKLALAPNDTSKTPILIKYNYFDVWAGRSFLLKRNGFTKMRQNLTISNRIIRNYFYERPEVKEKTNYFFQNKTLFLGAISYSRHSYFKSNYIYSFGRTEDIPLGNEIALTLGAENNEFFKRMYAAYKIAGGTFLGNLGYLYSSVNMGSFFLKPHKPEQALLNVKFNYFTPLLVIKKIKARQFLNINYTAGFERFKNEYLTINNNAGISGLVNDSLFGNHRLNMHWETVFFTPWIFYDFRFVLFAFADHSWLAKSSKNLLDTFPYTGIGLGIRIRNERLVFNTIQIRFSFFPRTPIGSRTNAILISGEPLLNPPNFLSQAPNVTPYQ
jgi:hypothetical protein